MTSDNEGIATEPDFSEFADWHVEEEEKEKWPKGWGNRPLTEKQEAIVGQNVKLLKDRDAWRAKTDAFEGELSKIEDEKARKQKRAEYSIHFDREKFPSGLLDLENYHFPCSVSFYGAAFGDGDVAFSEATFGDGYVSFFRTKFGDGDVSFSGATFGDGYVWFSGVKFRDTTTSFLDVVVKGNFLSSYNTYPSNAHFSRMSVGGTADFSHNTFHQVPDFTDSKIERPPDVSGMEVLAFKRKWIWPWWKADQDEGAKFRKLKAMALAANDHEKDGEFFAYEMLAKRGYEAGSTGPIALFINWLYFTFSNFGQSYKRPFSFLILSLLTGWVGYGLWIGTSLANADRWWFAFGYSFRNFMPLFGSLFRFAPKPSDHESWFDKTFHELAHSGFNVDWLTYVGIFQNFIGLIFLFLLLLGLRNKFRLK
ncbi:MAG: hypothetical protein ABJK39_01845 [Hyphomicrobiales bacterium]